MRDPRTFIPLNEELNSMIDKFKASNNDIISNLHLDQLEFVALQRSNQGYFTIPQEDLLRKTLQENL
jgi:hypothetical protein